MKFSILVPVYNVEKYLPECLESIENQTYRDFEVILVDDGSNDRSGEICDQFKERTTTNTTVLHKENQGLISARRIGINNAKGEYCIFCDSDDFQSVIFNYPFHFVILVICFHGQRSSFVHHFLRFFQYRRGNLFLEQNILEIFCVDKACYCSLYSRVCY